jgi:hypothetical protein
MIKVMLRFFAIEINPLLWGNCITAVYVCEYCILRDEIVRERRGSYNIHALGCIPSFYWIIKRNDLTISLVDIAHTG